MGIVYKYNEPVGAEDVIQVFKKSGITRPVEQKERIQKMLDHANIILTAWDDDKLVGIARALTFFRKKSPTSKCEGVMTPVKVGDEFR
ncbi:hypothetical protein [Aneurinibacillus danicus]|jgi:predicted GNAT superfamily acetyltransferase|uniref:N-acetyltransferase domain-containing protein n=1 Tax=Aneurinibacillus danicus TaxID=267746 RepID=A0A511VCN1_9BACL|nr:hypothetical protein [Aneurinibacillus danicus]GEN35688.1 hypothetical protein ADA01nite_31480 [Aneurinibacillus danicus]